MKKTLKITGITLAVVFVLLLTLPFLFQGKIMEMVKKEANEMLNAKVDFGKVSLSFIRNFPHATIVVNDFTIIGIDEFEGDTLASIDRLSATVNIKSFFGDQWEITRVRVVRPNVLAKVLPDGKVNWDIMKPSDEEEETDDSETSFNLRMQKLIIEKGYIIYDDQESNMKAILDNVNFELSGDMTQDLVTLKILTKVEKFSFLMDNLTYISNAELNAKMDIEADLKNDKYTFRDNEFWLNKINMNFEGWVAFIENGYDMDIKMNTPNIEFKDLLSMVPAIYANDFKKLQAGGKVKFDGAVKGIYDDNTFPAFDFKLDVANAHFRYPDLPKSVDNININAEVTKKQGDLDLTIVNVSKFHFEMGGNPFDLNARIATPMSDMQFKFGAKGTLNLDMIKDVYPLEKGMAVSGILKADLEVAGKMSQIEKEQYESIHAKGDLTLTNFTFNSADMLPVLINKASLNFTPRYVNLTAFDLKMGNNDIQATGRLENFIAYVLKDQTIKGELNVTSTLLNVNDFMGEEETATTADEEPMSVIIIPKNIDFNLSANFKKVTFDAMILENIKGNIRVKNGILHINNASMNAFGGTMGASGFYSTENIENPNVNMNLNIKDVLYTEFYKQMEMVQQFAPIFENMTGRFSMDLQFASKLDNTMSPILPSLTGNGVLTSRDLSISNIKVLDVLAGALKKDDLRTLKAKDITIRFAIKDGRIHTEPFDLKMGTTNMNVSGSTGLDQTIDYVGKIQFPQPQQMAQSQVLQNVNVTANLKFGGTFTNPTVKVDLTDLGGAIKDAAVQEVKSVVNENLGKAVEEARKQKDALVAQAQKQGDALRAEAQKAGNALVAEAEQQGQKLIAEANKTSNPIAKAAAVKTAEASAKKLKDEAQKKANDLNKTADDQANKLVNTATAQGDKLIQEAEAKAKV